MPQGTERGQEDYFAQFEKTSLWFHSKGLHSSHKRGFFFTVYTSNIEKFQIAHYSDVISAGVMGQH